MDMNITAFIIERDASLWLEKKTEKLFDATVKAEVTQHWLLLQCTFMVLLGLTIKVSIEYSSQWRFFLFESFIFISYVRSKNDSY